MYLQLQTEYRFLPKSICIGSSFTDNVAAFEFDLKCTTMTIRALFPKVLLLKHLVFLHLVSLFADGVVALKMLIFLPNLQDSEAEKEPSDGDHETNDEEANESKVESESEEKENEESETEKESKVGSDD